MLRIAENGMTRLLGSGEMAATTGTALWGEHGIPESRALGLRALVSRITEPAPASLAHARGSNPPATLQQSLRHKQVVDEYRKALKETLKAVRDLPRFTAALELERTFRADGVVVDPASSSTNGSGTCRWRAQGLGGGLSADVGFTRRGGAWYIRIAAKRPAPRRG